jgi:uncharacterized low-complexity protein
MKKTITNKTLISTIGTLTVSSLALVGSINAQANPFGATELSGGYMQLAEGSAGEGKCGADHMKKGEGKCGADHMKKGEGKCGADKMEMKKAEGKCGEGKCGADKMKADEAKGGADKMEMKKGEGSCGEGKCGADMMKMKKGSDADKMENNTQG